MAALGVGSEDLSTELEAVPGADSLYVYGMMAVAAARAARILPLGSIGVFADFSDLEAYRASLRRSRALGFGCAASLFSLLHVPTDDGAPRSTVRTFMMVASRRKSLGFAVELSVLTAT